MQIEYRSSRGTRLEVNANGQILPSSGPVNLRAMGCPDYIARKVENGDILRRAAKAMAIGAPAPAAPVTDADLRRRAAEIGQKIADDNAKFRADEELKKRLRARAGITDRGQ